MKKISRKSWHYKLLEWIDMVPSSYELTLRGYRLTIVLAILYLITTGWFIEGIRHLVSRSKSEPVEFTNNDEDNKNN